MGFAIPDNHNKLLRSFLVSAGLVVLAVAAQQAVQLAFDFEKGHSGGSSAGTPDPEDDQKQDKQEQESKRDRRLKDRWYLYNN